MERVTRLFRPTDVEIWRKLEAEIGARFHKGDFWHRDRIEVAHDDWTVTLDTFFSAATKHEYTRLRTAIPNPNQIQFTIFRRGLFSDLAKLLGMQDIELGHPQFDRDFIVKGNDENRLRALFSNDGIRELLSAQPDVHFSLAADGELTFTALGVIREIPRLKDLFNLFARMVDQVCQHTTPSDAG